MAWCERNRIGYTFGLAGNPVLRRQVAPLAEDDALGRLAILVEFAGFELGDPHPYQVAADAMPLGQAIERLASREFLTDLTLERDRMDAMLGRWAVFFKGPGTPG